MTNVEVSLLLFTFIAPVVLAIGISLFSMNNLESQTIYPIDKFQTEDGLLKLYNVADCKVFVLNEMISVDCGEKNP